MKRIHGAYRKPKSPRCLNSGKVPYPSQLSAENAAVTYKHRLGTTSTAYLCPHCNLWHLTTKAPRRKIG